MTNFLNALRSRRPLLSNGSERSGGAWRQRIGSQIATLWKPRRGESFLPGWLHLLVGMSDDGLRIPGTPVRVGLDAVLGMLLPGAGDALGGVTAAMLMFVAWRRGAPLELLVRMLGNASLDIAVGAIPVVGDIFDFGFHANRRNLTLLEGFLQRRSSAERVSRLGAAILFGLLLLTVFLAIAGTIGFFVWLWHRWHAGG